MGRISKERRNTMRAIELYENQSANIAINQSKLLDFYFILACTNSKIKRTYDKLVALRIQLETKIKFGI